MMKPDLKFYEDDTSLITYNKRQGQAGEYLKKTVVENSTPKICTLLRPVP